MLILLISLLLCFASAQKRLTDTEMMLMVMNNNRTRALMRDSILHVYVLHGKVDTASYRDCAQIAGAKAVVVYADRGRVVFKIEEIKK